MPVEPWHWRSLPLEQRSGSAVFAALFHPHHSAEANQTIATLLESPAAEGSSPQSSLARYSVCAGAPRSHQGRLRLWTPEIGQILPCLRERLGQPLQSASQDPDHLPFTGGWLGWLGYDLAWEIEALPRQKSDPLPFPVAYWYEPDCFAVLDHGDQTLWLAATDPHDLDRLQQHLEGAENDKGRSPHLALPGELISKLHFCPNQADYEAAVRQAQAYIQAGDIFQANLSLRFQTYTQIPRWALYQTLQQINPSPFASYWQTPWGAVISCSPERLVQLQGRQTQTRPIAGTRSRGRNAVEDQQQAKDLSSNVKENAEHIMLVDLERNDLGRVCEWGSVQVDELLTIERYSHVMHLVSNVSGTLRPECDAVDLIRAVFPGGTITGCPKVRCMEIIEALEPVRRNLFYGSCGYLDRRGNLDLNILIRTLLLAPSSFRADSPFPSHDFDWVWGQVGAGIVADSQPEKEWYESLDKAQALLSTLEQAGSAESLKFPCS